MSSEQTSIQKNTTFERNYQVDNIRFILISLVIFGHLIEAFPEVVPSQIYRVIYSFHMPAFIYLSGLYSSFSLRRILKHLVLPYAVFQMLYRLFRCLLANHFSFKISFTTPDWILWFLLSLIIYNLLLPVLDSVPKKYRVLIIFISFAVAIIVGFDSTVESYLTLSRTIVFFPFFILGYYRKKTQVSDSHGFFSSCIFRKPLLIILLLLVIEAALLAIQPDYPLYYCASPYPSPSDSLIRILILTSALLWIKLLFIFVPKRKMAIITSCGEYTLPIYLLHGFLVLWIRSRHLLQFSEPINCKSQIMTRVSL